MAARRHSLEERQQQLRAQHPHGGRRGRGRPPVEFDRSRVIDLAALGLNDLAIAARLHCHVKTLRRRYAAELSIGRAQYSAALKMAGHLLAVENQDVATLINLSEFYAGRWPGQIPPRRKPRRRKAPTPPVAAAPARAPEPQRQAWKIAEFLL